MSKNKKSRLKKHVRGTTPLLASQLGMTQGQLRPNCYDRDRFRAAGTYFNKVRTDPLEMQPLASSDPPTELQAVGSVEVLEPFCLYFAILA